MTKELAAKAGSRELAEFDPAKTETKLAALDHAIDKYRRIKNWPKLEESIDDKLEELTEFVNWWTNHVTVRQRPGDKRGALMTGLSLTSIPAADAEQLTGISPKQVQRIRANLDNRTKYRAKLFGAAYNKAFGETAHVGHNSGVNEWYTPPEIIEAARSVMGSIDCDPATSHKANEKVRADVAWTADDNGLVQPWAGNVWLNPPYAQPLISEFCSRLVQEIKTYGGAVEQACALVNNATETAWGQMLLAASSAVCLISGRVKFLDPDGNPGAPLQGQMLVYFGSNRAAFEKAFSDFGCVLYK